MKTKREVLEIIAKYKGCSLSCYDCPYSKLNTGKETCIVKKTNGNWGNGNLANVSKGKRV